MLGLNDTAISSSITRTPNDRGGSTAALTTVLENFACSIQPVRREEIRFEISGQNVIEPYLLMCENTYGDSLASGQIITFNSENYLIVVIGKISGKGTHTEAVLKKINIDSYVQ